MVINSQEYDNDANDAGFVSTTTTSVFLIGCNVDGEYLRNLNTI